MPGSWDQVSCQIRTAFGAVPRLRDRLPTNKVCSKRGLDFVYVLSICMSRFEMYDCDFDSPEYLNEAMPSCYSSCKYYFDSPKNRISAEEF